MHLSSTRLCLLFVISIFLLLSVPRRYLDPVRGRMMQMFGSTLPNRSLQENEKAQLTLKSLELENGQLRERVFDLEQLLTLVNSTSVPLAASVGAHVARVVYRSPAFWDSNCWIRSNSNSQGNAQAVLAKNSPIVLGNTLIGMIDLETPQQSRVRLITDPQLIVSVRVKRGEMYLAKGELCGSVHPIARTRGTRLSGVGFHYDFADEEGPARDLRSGQPVGHPDAPSVPLLAIGDTLVTTGMDGLFPKGLDVATVVAISPLQEGDYFYDLEAQSLVPSLDELAFVFVLPPLNVKNNSTDEL